MLVNIQNMPDAGELAIDPLAARGFTAAAEVYRRTRPGWPLAAIDAAFAHWGVDPAAGLVVDVGAGTGLLTEQLARRCPRLLAVEPLAEMRRHITAAEAVAGTGERLPLEDGAAQAIFVAEAFHWFHRPAALAEAGRVLRPGGGLGIMWNHPVPNGQPWLDELDALIAPHRERLPTPIPGRADPSDITDWRTGPDWHQFEPLTLRVFHHTQVLSRDAAVERVGSLSYIAALEDPVRAELLERVRAILIRHGVERDEQILRCDVHLTARR